MLGIAVIGTGFGSRVHLPALQFDSRCRVVAVCAKHLAHAEEAARQFSIARAYDDWRAALNDPGVDALTLAVPPGVQVSIVQAALSRGKPVFCEKPLAVDESAAQQLHALAAKSGLANMMNFGFPENDVWQRTRQLIDDGQLGPLRSVSVVWRVMTWANRNRVESWKTLARDGGGTLNNFGSHVLHYLELFGGRIDRLRAQLHRASDDPRAGDTRAEIEVQFTSGATGTISLEAAAESETLHRLEFVGERQSLTLVNDQSDYLNGFRLFRAQHNQELTPVLPDGFVSTSNQNAPDGRIATTARLISRFLDWVETGRSAGPNFEDGLRVQRLLSAAARSAETAAWQDVST